MKCAIFEENGNATTCSACWDTSRFRTLAHVGDFELTSCVANPQPPPATTTAGIRQVSLGVPGVMLLCAADGCGTTPSDGWLRSRAPTVLDVTHAARRERRAGAAEWALRV